MDTNRRNITAALYDNVDDDLIQWVDSLPPKSKVSDEIKAVLRRGLDLPIPGAPQLDADTIEQEIARQVATAVQPMNEILSRVPTLIRQHSGNGQTDNLREQMERIERQHEADMNELADQLNDQHESAMQAQRDYFERRLNELAANGLQIAPTSAELEEAERVSQAEIEARKANMKRTAW